MDPKKINKIIDFVREEMMTTGSTPGKPGFSGEADDRDWETKFINLQIM